ncbi:mobilization protein MobC (plasmid) [Pantoea stewartii]|uniref:mobilization protein MobC n=1 Tax=Pantoea stewartii TaxID=66269 RepID=UPI0013DD9E10|nr:mobilization protein MobC [Pantoea stewartii]QIE99886.1 mobilization protein MobC [Pantoea stewartii]
MASWGVEAGNFHHYGAESPFLMFPLEGVMATQQFFTQEQIDEAKSRLENLPDLSPKRITRNEVLESLRGTILMLAKEKGYNAKDIKSALDEMQFGFSERAISDVLKDNGKGKKQPRDRKVKNTVTGTITE